MRRVAGERSCKIVPGPRAVIEARRFAELAVHSCDQGLSEAAIMAVSELAENIVKYGAKTESVFAGSISIAIEQDVIRIRATNTVANDHEAEDVKSSIAQIASAADATSVYRARLAELLANPRLSRTQLGLFRIAIEGGFRMSCSYERPILAIVAERSFSRP